MREIQLFGYYGGIEASITVNGEKVEVPLRIEHEALRRDGIMRFRVDEGDLHRKISEVEARRVPPRRSTLVVGSKELVLEHQDWNATRFEIGGEAFILPPDALRKIADDAEKFGR